MACRLVFWNAELADCSTQCEAFVPGQDAVPAGTLKKLVLRSALRLEKFSCLLYSTHKAFRRPRSTAQQRTSSKFPFPPDLLYPPRSSSSQTLTRFGTEWTLSTLTSLLRLSLSLTWTEPKSCPILAVGADRGMVSAHS